MIKFALIFLFAINVSAEPDFVKKPSKNSVAETLNKLEKALKKKGITIFARVDHAAGAKSIGKTLAPTELLIFGNPKLGSPLMQSQPMIGLDLPMKALAWKDGSGKVWLAYTKPSALKNRYGIGDRDKVFDKMTGALDKLTTAATK